MRSILEFVIQNKEIIKKNINVILCFLNFVVCFILIVIFVYHLNYFRVMEYIIDPYYAVVGIFIVFVLLCLLFVYYGSVFFFASIIFLCLASFFIYNFFIHYDIVLFDSFNLYFTKFSIKYSFETKFNYIQILVAFFNADLSLSGANAIILNPQDLQILLSLDDRSLLDMKLLEIIKNKLIQKHL